MIVDYESVGNSVNMFVFYGLGFNYKYLLEMIEYMFVDVVLLFMLLVGNYYKGMLMVVLFNLVCLDKVLIGQQIYVVLVDYFVVVVNGFVDVVLLEVLEWFEDFDLQVLNEINCLWLYVFVNDVCVQVVIIVVYDNFGKGVFGVVV